jgi:DNA-binding transcriptional MerR regulator
VAAEVERFRIGELADRAGVSVATIKFYIREGLLPPPPVKTGRTMAYYDAQYLERLRTIRRLREEHYLPLRVIRAVLAERGDAPLTEADAATLAAVAPGVLSRLDPVPAAPPHTRADILAAYPKLSPDELALLEEMGLVGGEHGYTASDLELLEALRRAEEAGVTRARFPAEGLGHYVELLGELARREVHNFTGRTRDLPAAELEELALRAIAVSEPIIAAVRRKLLLRALRSELERAANKEGEEP